MRDTPRRFVVVHGHFYQPPRENPWIEAIEKQPSAAPYHDWNERVAWECYIPNQAARVMAGSGRILDVVNNYSWMSFNFGPTLLSWLEHAAPREYRAVLEADRASAARLGKGNAIAQAFNHPILPLSSPRDRATQVRWGLADFRRRFGRAAEALWLPETAVNADTLRTLIDHGLRFAILSPAQADKARRLGRGGRWHDVSDGSIPTRRAYRWFDKDPRGRPYHDRHIDLLFYDDGLANAVAFEHAMRDSKAFADRVEASFDPASREDQLVHFATDGESYGHHEKYGEMGLAHLLKHELPRRGIEVVNYSSYLDLQPPLMEVEIKGGPGTAWSCTHGLGRWLEDCGCGGGNWHQKWRGPLRRALDWLRDELTAMFEWEGSRVFRDPWAARDAYVDVVLDRSENSLETFLKAHLSAPITPESRERALKLLELQRHSMLMFTSCGWFFSELSGVEGVQILKYAARAVQLARELTGRDLEPELLPRLKEAPSNLPEFGDGWGVWVKLVLPAVVTPDHVAGQYAISHLFGEPPETSSVYHYRFERESLARSTVAGARLVAGKIRFESGITGSRWTRLFLAIALQDETLRAFVGEGGEFEPLRERLLSLKGEDLLKGLDHVRGPLFQGQAYSLEDLFGDERERVFSLIIEGKLQKLESVYDRLFDEYFPIVEELERLHLAVPPVLRQEVELALGRRLARDMRSVLDGGRVEGLQQPLALLRKAKRTGVHARVDETEKDWTRRVESALDALESGPSLETASAASALFEFGLEADLSGWRLPAETRLFRMLASGLPASQDGALAASIRGLAAKLGIAV